MDWYKAACEVICRIVMMLVFICHAGICPAVWADEKIIEIFDITPVISEELTHENIPAVFHGKGIIDRMEGMEIVVGDRLFDLSRDVSYYTKQGEEVARNQFHTGLLVGYLKNLEGSIYALYKLE
ncbi:hypothetical protein [Desulfocicer niacini]